MYYHKDFDWLFELYNRDVFVTSYKTRHTVSSESCMTHYRYNVHNFLLL